MMRHYFEMDMANIDQYTGIMTSRDGRTMDFTEGPIEDRDYLLDMHTGEKFLVVKGFCDGETELYITEA